MKQSEVDPAYCRTYCTAGRFMDKGRRCMCGNNCLNPKARKLAGK